MKTCAFLMLMVFSTAVSARECQVTCTALMMPEEVLQYWWADAQPGQCPNQERCVAKCDEGSGCGFCLEEEEGQSKAGICLPPLPPPEPAKNEGLGRL